jgi:glutamate synthase (NADPH) large chain
LGPNDGWPCDASGAPRPQGLYDPAWDRDSCGVGFVAHLDGLTRHAVVEDAVRILINLEHRGALGGDTCSGDGAGVLVQIPDSFLRAECHALRLELPRAGDYAVGTVFLPSSSELCERCVQAFERIAEAEGCDVVGWRRVPVNAGPLGELARATQPEVRQIILSRRAIPRPAFERKLYVVRRLVEKEVAAFAEDASQFHVASLSSRTIVYKGMLTATQIPQFYPDLRDERFESAFGIVHQRYSTNTFPMWRLAQPFRILAHNGEINTLRGNITRMRAREALLASELFGADIEKIKPVILEGGSDSAMLDNVAELLLMSGRSLPHVMMMLVPEAWGGKFLMSEDKRAFYEYHSAVMEPWDGPAALVFTDGLNIGATLDRNGLRPARYTVTRDGLVVLASETGVLDIPGDRILSRGRLQPGKMFLVDLSEHRIIPDNEIKAKVSRQRPYRHWVKEQKIELRGLLAPSQVPPEEPDVLRRKEHVFGYTQEDLKMIIGPMAARGQEAVGSMGNDAALAVLSPRPQLLFAYFKQLFAQVTNPPIDPLREELVMSLMSFVGRERNLLAETPEHCRQLKLHHPVLTPEDMLRLQNSKHPEVVARDIDILFPADGNGPALEAALDAVFLQAERHLAEGATLLILTDRGLDEKRAPIPSLLAASGLHHYLIRKGLRPAAGILVETGETREVIHFAMLLAFGANAVCPYLAFSTVRDLAENGLLEESATPDEAMDSYITAVKKGLLKTFSRMGISTIRSFCGSQIFEAVGLGPELIAKYFTSTVSRVGGIGLEEIAAETRARHAKAFPKNPAPPQRLLDVGGAYHARAGGEKHLWSPKAIYSLQQAVRLNDYATFKEYSRAIGEPDSPALKTDGVDGENGRRLKPAPQTPTNSWRGIHPAGVTLRSLLRFKRAQPIPIEEVEPVEKIIPRFASSAMSFGSISPEAHETIAVAMNRLGARSNSGEGGEDPARYAPLPNGDSRRSRTKQVASGRFGVTTEYLMSADELQIKIAQGAKPGEGGQLPGHKVSAEIARVRHTTPGVTLISPPPHHDIYSIEDIAQLIHDLKCVNPRARVSVKLVSEVGVGTIAAGVAKAKADMILIAGHDGGTGASPLTAIKHAGLPWELGLSETHQTLIANRLRDRVRVQVDGQLRTGRDLAIAALLGAEEFGFGTPLLVSLGCVMLRKCHMNTCSVGVGTQDPALRARFAGKPEYVERFLRFIAQEFREQMAQLGFRTVDEMIGHVDRIEFPTPPDGGKASRLDFSAILYNTQDARVATNPQSAIRNPQSHSPLNAELLRLAAPALDSRQAVRLEMPIRNVDRATGATLSGEIVRRFGPGGLPEGAIELSFKGSAGQSLGAFLAPGIAIRVEGDANDYLGKGMSGGRVVLVPPANATFAAHENVIAGNVALYGATAGEVYINGLAGERFAVRNSGARAVVEGLGDHGCEYMTGGTVVVLGPTGYNFAAGMSGGIAYVYNESGILDTRCNLDMVDLETVWSEEDKTRLRALIETHLRHTGSLRAKRVLENWEASLPLFVKVMPIDYRKSLERMRMAEDTDHETVSATEEVFSK